MANFYDSIPAFSNFSELGEDRHYRRLPKDWHVVLADVKASTQAVREGRYKDVNRLGAAAIVCAQKALAGIEFPFSFGGDGATLLVPSGRLEKVRQSLAGLQLLAQQHFDLSLRVGWMSGSDLQQRGLSVEVARYQQTGGACLALLRGTGLAAAEEEIKRSALDTSSETPLLPDLDELSCRWRAVPASRGRSVSLLVEARGPEAATTYRRVLDTLEEILHARLEAANPIQLRRMSYRGWWECLRDEGRQFTSAWSPAFLAKALRITASVTAVKSGGHRIYDPRGYFRSIASHCDYRKFDGQLKLTLDCEPAQAMAMKFYLEGLRQAGEIYYGLNESKETLITCYVRNVGPEGHLHFVDGADGGYTLAAVQLKEQKAGAAISPTPL
jgi:hypothetical protein